jgi:ABC-type glutathione transport system ATPase component
MTAAVQSAAPAPTAEASLTEHRRPGAPAPGLRLSLRLYRQGIVDPQPGRPRPCGRLRRRAPGAVGRVLRVPAPVVVAHGLRKAYGPHVAVKDIDFEVHEGEIFGFLGTNGAGKTTTIEILEGYRPRTAGEVSVLGLDPARATRAWRERLVAWGLAGSALALRTFAWEPLAAGD